MARLVGAISRWTALHGRLVGLLATANFTSVFNRFADAFCLPGSDEVFSFNISATLDGSL